MARRSSLVCDVVGGGARHNFVCLLRVIVFLEKKSLIISRGPSATAPAHENYCIQITPRDFPPPFSINLRPVSRVPVCLRRASGAIQAAEIALFTPRGATSQQDFFGVPFAQLRQEIILGRESPTCRPSSDTHPPDDEFSL